MICWMYLGGGGGGGFATADVSAGDRLVVATVKGLLI